MNALDVLLPEVRRASRLIGILLLVLCSMMLAPVHQPDETAITSIRDA
jgi:hypothetical protein